jgi:glycerophosphoryl diester phosphodiesterase
LSADGVIMVIHDDNIDRTITAGLVVYIRPVTGNFIDKNNIFNIRRGFKNYRQKCAVNIEIKSE